MTKDSDIHPAVIIVCIVMLGITVSTAVAMEKFPFSPALVPRNSKQKICCLKEAQVFCALVLKSNKRLLLPLLISCQIIYPFVR